MNLRGYRLLIAGILLLILGFYIFDVKGSVDEENERRADELCKELQRLGAGG